MDLSGLASLGKVAGIGGVALGMVVLVVRPLIARMSLLPSSQREGVFRFLLIGSFAVGALGIVAWLAGNSGSVTATSGPCAIAAGRDASHNNIDCSTGNSKP